LYSDVRIASANDAGMSPEKNMYNSRMLRGNVISRVCLFSVCLSVCLLKALI